MPTPEALARTHIDAQLAACGWVVQDRAAINHFTARVARLLRQAILKRAFEGQLVEETSR